MTEEELELAEAVVDEAHAGMRADRFVSEALELFPRSQLKTRGATIRVNGRAARPSRTVHAGDHVVVEYGPVPLPELEPEDIPLSIVYEDDSVLIVDKHQGMVVHPARGNYTGTLAHAVLHHVSGLAGRFGPDSIRPGIVHRLDKDTSGIIVVAKDVAAHEELARQFHDREVRKTYLAVTKSVPKARQGTVEGFIRRDTHNRKRFAHDEAEGKPAVTRYRLLRSLGDHAVVVLEPKTGRTHQLRVHMAHIGCPILGDPVYARRSRRFPDATLMLHAFSLELRLPGETATRRFTAPVPRRFADIVTELTTAREA